MKTERKKAAKTVKMVKKETEQKIRKKLLKANKAKIAKAIKANKVRMNRILKTNNTRITKKIRENNTRIKDILTGIKHRPKPKKQPITNPFDLRRFRGNRKKETPQQRLKRLGEHIYTIRDQILYGIACGRYKFKWASLAKECGFKTGERKKILSLLDNNGYSVNSLAHHLWEENENNRQHTDDHTIRNQIIDVLCSIGSPSDALDLLYRNDAPF
jgi:hypothetical protein